MIGAADAAANLLCEFNIAEKKEDKLTKNKNGNVILVRRIVSSSLSLFSLKPGAMIKINPGINISIIKTTTKRLAKSKLKILFANFWEFFFPIANSEEQLGTNAALKVPSENNLLNVFGILKATKKASATGPDPRYIANNKSLTYPKILLIKVKKLNVVVDLIRFINHISLKIAPFVYLNYLNEKNKN